VNLLGHSHGGLCAFEAALLTPNLCRLIVYEGIPLHGAEEIKADLVERLEAMLRAGDTEGTLVTMLNELLELPREEPGMMRAQQDAWAVRLANTLTMPRELGAFERYGFTPQRFMAMDTPTLLLVGEKSPLANMSMLEPSRTPCPGQRSQRWQDNSTWPCTPRQTYS
jgi:pimeloyl-ACP methyl ester carboxylesterase